MASKSASSAPTAACRTAASHWPHPGHTRPWAKSRAKLSGSNSLDPAISICGSTQSSRRKRIKQHNSRSVTCLRSSERAVNGAMASDDMLSGRSTATRFQSHSIKTRRVSWSCESALESNCKSASSTSCAASSEMPISSARSDDTPKRGCLLSASRSRSAAVVAGSATGRSGEKTERMLYWPTQRRTTASDKMPSSEKSRRPAARSSPRVKKEALAK
mmetsp:Transcript_45286/g.111087  ORF Transcript_45286/g.111087 Transcript_45286/m.111087 type:complete len:217 (-) Transcript_45286:343-993(-)